MQQSLNTTIRSVSYPDPFEVTVTAHPPKYHLDKPALVNLNVKFLDDAASRISLQKR